MPRRPALVQQLLLRAATAEASTLDKKVGSLVVVLVETLSGLLESLDDPNSPAYADAFMALSAAVDVAEALVSPQAV